MPTPTIPDGRLFMNATLYTGTGASQAITNGGTGTSFAPDFVWAKQRGAATDHVLYDVIRTGTNSLSSNTTGAEVNQTSNGCTVAFNSNGFTVGADTAGYLNYPSRTYVGWNWKAGGTAVSNTAGTITSQVSANTTSGFSIATYTSQASGTATVGHGLGVAPKMIIIKPRTGTLNWYIYHASLGAGNYILFTTAGTVASSTLWNNTAPTSSVFSLGTDWNGSISSVAYCWSEVAGYSKFGSYTGNGSADGPFVYLGFRPRFVLIKRTDSTENWQTVDSSRDPYNVTTSTLFPNLSNAESTGVQYDLLSNGFKLKSTTGGGNASGGTYIYAAFAENPFKYSNAR
jgi:hypothetical protein